MQFGPSWVCTRDRAIHGVALCVVALITGCAAPRTPTQAEGLGDMQSMQTPEWQGRLSVQIQQSPPSSMSAGFSLRGNATHGTLDLYSPLGTTLATLRWMPGAVWWLQGNQQQRFHSLDDLTEQATGAALPVASLFDWLHGQATPAPGWLVDLSGLGQGSLNATRTSPTPVVTLRLKLDP